MNYKNIEILVLPRRHGVVDIASASRTKDRVSNPEFCNLRIKWLLCSESTQLYIYNSTLSKTLGLVQIVINSSKSPETAPKRRLEGNEGVRVILFLLLQWNPHRLRLWERLGLDRWAPHHGS
jgi:hypothetical protein